MPTNIIDGRADAVGPSGWSTVGGGLGQIGQLLAATMGAAAADKKAKEAANAALPAPTGFGEGSSFGPSGPVNVSPPVQTPGSVTPMDIPITRQPMEMLPQPAANPFGGANDMGFKLGRDESNGVGLSSILPMRFPGLFPQRNLTQYGGL